MLLSHWLEACEELSSVATPPPAGWSSASANWHICCSHCGLSSGRGQRPLPTFTWANIKSLLKKINTLNGRTTTLTAWKLYNLKLRLAVRFVFVLFEGCAHQVIEAGIPEIRHNVVAPTKCVQLVLVHGGLNLEERIWEDEYKVDMATGRRGCFQNN